MNIDLCSEIEIFNLVYERKITKYPRGFWQPPDGIVYSVNILKHLLENILQWNEEQIIKSFNASLFNKYKLNGMLTCVFDSSPFKAIDAVYPNRFKQWQFAIPKGYWRNEENIINAIKEVYEEKLGITNIDEIYNIKNHRDIFLKYGLNSIIQIDKMTTHEAICMAYPDLREEKFYRSSQSFYENDLQHYIELLRKVIKENNLTHDEITKMTTDSLRKYNLYHLISNKSNMIIYDIIELAFPGEFKPWEFPKIKNGFWKDQNNINNAVKWLIEERLKIDVKRGISISKTDFIMNNLESLVVYSDMNHIGLKNIIRSVYGNCHIKFKRKKSRTIDLK